MENYNILNQKELITIEGGTFAWDAGWFLGNLVTGNFLDHAGVIEALVDYQVHYYN